MGLIRALQNALAARRTRNALPPDPFGEPQPEAGMTKAARDLNGHKFAWIANRLG